jgi:uncharacterized protein with von Willebrand factor type A (vWA) domain
MSGAAGKFALNVMHFARLLRRAGLPVGPADLLAAQQALLAVDIASRAQVRAALAATLVHRHEHAELFDQAFQLFWRDPEAGRHAAVMALLASGQKSPPERPAPGSRRLAEATHAPRGERAAPPRDRIEAALTASQRELLQSMDFEAMSAAEIEAAKASHPAPASRPDRAARRSARHGPAQPAVGRRDRRNRRVPPGQPAAAAGRAVRH